MRFFHVVLLMIWSGTVVASEEGERHDLARQLTELADIKELYSERNAKCVPDTPALRASLGDLYAQHPAEFGGISPKSAYWAEVERIYREYYLSSCAAQTKGFEQAYVDTYARTMSVEDLRAAIAFMRSPAGMSMRAGSRSVFRELSERLLEAGESYTDAPAAAFRQAILMLKQQYDSDPK